MQKLRDEFCVKFFARLSLYKNSPDIVIIAVFKRSGYVTRIKNYLTVDHYGRNVNALIVSAANHNVVEQLNITTEVSLEIHAGDIEFE